MLMMMMMVVIWLITTLEVRLVVDAMQVRRCTWRAGRRSEHVLLLKR